VLLYAAPAKASGGTIAPTMEVIAVVPAVLVAGSFSPSHLNPVLGMTARQPTTFMRAAAADRPTANGGASADGTVLYIQTVRYRSETSDAQIKELLESLQRTLSRISEVKSIRVGRIVDQPREYDYAVAMEFDNLDDLRSYANSPIHRQWVQAHNPGPVTASHMTLTIQTGLGR
jgi:Stress responsive A/B Barrel Domain